jgi:hypothetical protein
MQSKLFLSLVLQERKQEEKKNSTIIVPLPIERKRNNVVRVVVAISFFL